MPVSDPWELTHGQDANKNGNVSETIYDGNRSICAMLAFATKLIADEYEGKSNVLKNCN